MHAAEQLALEWLDQNMHTSYPFAFSRSTPVTAASGIVLPSSFIVDIQLVVDDDIVGTAAVDRYSACAGFYVSKIEAVSGDMGEQPGYRIEVSYSDKGAVAMSQLVPYTLASGSDNDLEDKTFQLYAVGNTGNYALDSVQGSVVIGTSMDMHGLGTLTFSQESAPILPTRALLVSRGLDSVTVVGTDNTETRLTDALVIKAGSGIDLSVDTDTSTVTITDTTILDQNAEDMIDSLVSEVYTRLGEPIRSINGIWPNSSGNFTLAGGDCTEVVPNGSTGLRVNNPCSRPCCGDVNREQLETALAALETAQARLLSYYQSLSNNVNSIQARLASLLAMK